MISTVAYIFRQNSKTDKYYQCVSKTSSNERPQFSKKFNFFCQTLNQKIQKSIIQQSDQISLKANYQFNNRKSVAGIS